MATKTSRGGEQAARTRAAVLPELLDDATVGSLLNCSPRHVRRMADAGRLPPAVKVGKLTRWSRLAIDSWIAEGCRPVRIVRAGGVR
jgi:excisionase family DNA binding protein